MPERKGKFYLNNNHPLGIDSDGGVLGQHRLFLLDRCSGQVAVSSQAEIYRETDLNASE